MQGAGFVCYYILDCLATQALKVTKPLLGRPEIKTNDDIKAEIVENTNEIILEKVEEEQYGGGGGGDGDGSDDEFDEDDDDEMELAGRLNLRENMKIRDLSASHRGDSATDRGSMLTGEMWKMEMERAMPRLKIVVKTDLKDWRARWDQMKVCRENINSVGEKCCTDPNSNKIIIFLTILLFFAVACR